MTISRERLQSIARKIVGRCAGVKAGDDVYIEGRTDAAEYLELLAFECEMLGAKPFVAMTSDQYAHRRLTELPEDQLATRAAGWIEAVRRADVVFTVMMEAGDPALFADVTAERRTADRRGRKLVADLIYDGTRRWVGTDYPTPGQAAAFQLDAEAYAAMFWRSLDVDYDQLLARADAAAELFDGARRVRITSPAGTDVTLGIAGRPLDKDVGVLSDEARLTNLPAGEVCLAPLEDQVDGTVVFDLAFWHGRRVEGLEVRFEAGRATPVRARTEFAYVRDLLASADAGASVIGELGVGLNPEVGEPCGNTLTDEKILGTVHLALGDNRMLGGRNESILHWDMMVLRPTVVIDGRPLLVGGVWRP